MQIILRIHLYLRIPNVYLQLVIHIKPVIHVNICCMGFFMHINSVLSNCFNIVFLNRFIHIYVFILHSRLNFVFINRSTKWFNFVWFYQFIILAFIFAWACIAGIDIFLGILWFNQVRLNNYISLATIFPCTVIKNCAFYLSINYLGFNLSIYIAM